MTLFRHLTILFLLTLISISGLQSQSASDDFIHTGAISQEIATPMRIAVDALDNIYVADISNNCIKKFDAAGNLLATLAEGSHPVSVAISPSGDLFYGDEETGYIYNLGAGMHKEVFYTGTQYPSEMVFSPDNILYVADIKMLKVLAINISGELTGSIGEGTVVFPTGLAYDAGNDQILVTEHGGIGENVSGSGWFVRGPLVKVYMFDRQGNLLNSFGTFGDSDGDFYRLQGVTIGRCGHIYLCEPWQGNINVFDINGNFITKFGEYGNEAGQLNMPMDVAFNSQDQIIVSCYNKGSLELFSIDDNSPSATITTPYITECQGGQADVHIELGGTPPWSITYVFNEADPITINDIYNSPFILTLTQAGEFTITEVADATATSNCIAGAATVSFHPEPSASIRIGDQDICHGDIFSIPVYFTGDGPWTFSYTHDGIPQNEIITLHNPYILEVSESGNYALSSVSGNNCPGSVYGSVNINTIPLPEASFTDGNIQFGKCGDEPSVDLEIAFTGTPPWSFTYTVDDLNPVTIQTYTNPYMLAAQHAGTYEVKFVSDANCSSSISDGYPELLIYPEPTVEIMATELGLCPRSTNYIPIQFSGTAPWTFTIQRYGAPAETITTSENPYMHPVNFIGEYTVHTLSDQFCTGNPAGVSIRVRHANPPTAVMPGEDIILCEGLSAEIPITFTGTAPWTFTYDINGAGSVTIETSDNPYMLLVDSPGTCIMSALSDANCDARHLPNPINIVQYPVPEAAFTYLATDLQVNFSNTSVNAVQYLWDFGDGNTSTEMNPLHNYALSGDYEVRLDATNNECGTESITQTVSVFSLKNFSATLDKEEDGELQVNVYPNPSEGLFIIELSGICSDDIYIEVINMAGQVKLHKKPNLPDETTDLETFTQQLDLSSYTQGIYNLRVRCGEQVVSQLLSVVRN